MAQTPSTMIPLGTLAPAFNLKNTLSGKILSLDELKSPKATVVMFICNHCPFVKLIFPQLVEVAKAYQQKGISFIAINSNDAQAYPDDGPEKMQAEAAKRGFSFPYLYDESQEVAKAYQAACTPDFFVFDGALKCVYRGRFDEATPGNGKDVTGKDLCAALDALLTDAPVNAEQLPSVGCNIKWRAPKAQ